MKKLILILSSLFIFSSIASCDDDSDSGGGSKFSSNEEFIAAFNNDVPAAMCDYFKKCPSPDMGIDFSSLSDEECKTFLHIVMMGELSAELSYALEQGTTYNEDNYNTCLDSIKNAGCNENPGYNEACTYIVRGTKQAGEPCSVYPECAEGLYCDTGYRCPGSCVAYAQTGESCENTECAPGLRCGSDETCIAATYAKAGESCENADCEYGTSCKWWEREETPTCYAWLNEGDICIDSEYEGEPGDEYRMFDCNIGLGCNLETQKCEKIIFVREGENCNGSNVCDKGYRCNEGICTVIPSEGDDCFDSDQCEWGLHCDDNDNKCHLIKSVGDSCSSDNECEFYKCENNKCVYDPCDYAVGPF